MEAIPLVILTPFALDVGHSRLLNRAGLIVNFVFMSASVTQITSGFTIPLAWGLVGACTVDVRCTVFISNGICNHWAT